ncbi:MAG: T9SS type A sorting domain-containing protein [Candidatus Marinimicrobia bacterium]|nr:T9SS type A sorting domain-containing protein [Candidatus Neomarinimicrobiota bacterium]
MEIFTSSSTFSTKSSASLSAITGVISVSDLFASTNATNGNFLAVKFTPNSYPVDLYKAKFNIVGSNGGIAFVNIWDDDGDEGMPGTLLLNNSAIQLVPGWTEKDLYSSGITIEEGSFYVGWMESTNTPPLGVDTDSPADYSMINIGAGWQAFSDYFDGALMIRCEVDSVNATAGIDDDLSPSVPKEFGLKQNYPNPFNPTTTIAFDLAQSGKTTLKVYDLSGKEVMTLIDKNMNAGEYKFGLNASDLSSGMYIYRLTTLSKDGQQLYGQSRKLVLMK